MLSFPIIGQQRTASDYAEIHLLSEREKKKLSNWLKIIRFVARRRIVKNMCEYETFFKMFQSFHFARRGILVKATTGWNGFSTLFETSVEMEIALDFRAIYQEHAEKLLPSLLHWRANNRKSNLTTALYAYISDIIYPASAYSIEQVPYYLTSVLQKLHSIWNRL